jgi:hypothetical protein
LNPLITRIVIYGLLGLLASIVVFSISSSHEQLGKYEEANQNLVLINKQQSTLLMETIRKNDISNKLVAELKVEGEKSHKTYERKIEKFKNSVSDDRCAVIPIPASVNELLNH